MVMFVVVMSVIDIPEQVGQAMLHDKFLHLIAYAGMMGWFTQLFRHDLTRCVLLLFFVALGIVMECAQALVPQRQFEYLDMVANTSGVLLAWAMAYTRFGEVLPGVERYWQRVLH